MEDKKWKNVYKTRVALWRLSHPAVWNSLLLQRFPPSTWLGDSTGRRPPVRVWLYGSAGHPLGWPSGPVMYQPGWGSLTSVFLARSHLAGWHGIANFIWPSEMYQPSFFSVVFTLASPIFFDSSNIVYWIKVEIPSRLIMDFVKGPPRGVISVTNLM